MFYTNVSLIGEKIHVRYVEKGVKKQNKIKFAPSYFLPRRNGEFRSLTEKPLLMLLQIQLRTIAKKSTTWTICPKKTLRKSKLEF